MPAIQGSTAWISGAAQGIGLAVARELVAKGANVVMADLLDETKGQSLAADLCQLGAGTAVYDRVDVTDTASLHRSLVEKPQEAFGCCATIVVNNAGIVVNDDAGDAKIKSMMDVNMMAVMKGTQMAAEAIRSAGKKGVVINTASMGGLLPLPETQAYAASKWAVVGFSISCRPLKKSHGVRVNCVCPAMTQTPAVGTFFAKKFKEQDANHPLLKDQLLPEEVADAYIALIENDKLNSQAAAIMPQVSYLHNFDFVGVTMQGIQDGVKLPRRARL
ncbi:15-hydroxyprostaglandin dehydrogenase [NAD(+)] [Symbiodinium microadriaticum]|uniref:15-hydroxyprostaglandin dehydrogenase [NAD(+)] n=1 Tax=Symbiodinium microadriaticum TaxID=2951 RepID=A0A1Q9E1T1_SYMMI|nr:15-hydroxyprostaglandin dehydrogenase [NAD(+)] [Symbiodinium microadriaticum]CAE7205566.1 Hpgd [Symbiodinium sp. KB8]CAE7216969.1 Hpgd [Symbiodinium microadriaticum]